MWLNIIHERLSIELLLVIEEEMSWKIKSVNKQKTIGFFFFLREKTIGCLY